MEREGRLAGQTPPEGKQHDNYLTGAGGPRKERDSLRSAGARACEIDLRHCPEGELASLDSTRSVQAADGSVETEDADEPNAPGGDETSRVPPM